MEASPAQLLASLALGLTCLIGIVVGGRTLVVWLRTRQFAELAIGLNCISLSAGAALIVLLTRAPALKASAPGAVLWGLSLVLLGTHVLAMFFGTWQIFRASRSWPLVLCAPAALAVILFVIWSWLAYEPSAERSLLYDGTRLVGFAWTSYECFRFSSQLRRRARLGLGDAAIAHRIALWGIASGSQLATSALSVFSSAVLGLRIMDTSGGLLTVAVLGLSGSLCIALAFFPPRAYTRWLSAAESPA
ncbi:MAG: hypothetical protein ACQGVK_15815 [Myxococcota bacterium]